MLTGVIQDEDLLKQAVIAFFDPATKENAVLRQALSYFLPVFCHSQRGNMEKMALVAPGVIHAAISFVEELDEEEEIVGIGVVGNMLLDWTDARKLVVQDEVRVSWDEAGRKEVKAVNGDIHLDLGEHLLEKVMSHGCTSKLRCAFLRFGTYLRAGEEKKAIIPLLGKLYIAANSTPEKLQVIYELVTEAIDIKVANEAASRNALSKLHMALKKVIGEAGTARRSVEEETVPDVALEESIVMAKAESMEDGETQIADVIQDAEIKTAEEEGKTEAQDSLLEDLLDDEDMEL